MNRYRVRALVCVCALVSASLAWGQEEGGGTALPAANLNATSYQMKPVTADIENTDKQRIEADSDHDNWRLHGRTYDNQRFSPLTQINASNVKKLLPVALIQTGMANAMEATPLEIDGVLKSWAVPKGPSLDPGVKSYAAHVEDHPVEYGNFEGNIPAGNYGGGSVMLWDRGDFEVLGDMPPLEQLARGDLKFRLHGEKLKGDYAIVHMKVKGKGNDWLLIKKRDQFAVPGWDIESVAYSVLSGRTQEEIAQVSASIVDDFMKAFLKRK